MANPTMVYKVGKMLKHDGNWFDYKIVDADAEDGKQSDFEKAIGDGWFKSSADALKGLEPDVEPDNSPATRAELDLKAEELGLSYRSDIGDENLLKRIEEALAAKGE